MVHRNLHHVVVAGHLRALMRRQLVGRAEAEPSPMEIDHHRPQARQAGRPDVQLQHVFAEIAVVPVIEERHLYGLVVVQRLRAVAAVDQGRIFVSPGHRRLGRQPAVFAAGVLTVGNALERIDAAVEEAAHLAILRPGHGRAGRGAIARRLVGGGLGAVHGADGSGQAQPCGGRQQQRLSTTHIHVPMRSALHAGFLLARSDRPATIWGRRLSSTAAHCWSEGYGDGGEASNILPDKYGNDVGPLSSLPLSIRRSTREQPHYDRSKNIISNDFMDAKRARTKSDLEAVGEIGLSELYPLVGGMRREG